MSSPPFAIRWLVLAVFAATLLAPWSAARPPAGSPRNYEFTALATSPLMYAIGPVTLNRDGEAVAVTGILGMGVNVVGCDGAHPLHLMLSPQEAASIPVMLSPYLDDRGRTVLTGYLTGGVQAMYSLQPDGAKVLLDTREEFASFGSQPILAKETLIFRARTKTDEDAIWQMNLRTGRITPLVRTGNGIHDFEIAQPATNARGETAFGCRMDDGTLAIYVLHGNRLNKLVDTQGPFSRLNIGGIDRHGRVAFTARLDEGGEGVYLAGDDGIITIKDTREDDSIDGVGGFVSINERGHIAFMTYDGNRATVHLWDRQSQAVVQTVLTRGDVIDGSAVRSMNLGRFSLNDRGQIGLAVTFNDEREAIYRADPAK